MLTLIIIGALSFLGFVGCTYAAIKMVEGMRESAADRPLEIAFGTIGIFFCVMAIAFYLGAVLTAYRLGWVILP